jgi:HEAT repeat protein
MNINQLLVQARVAYEASDWSLLILFLQQLMETPAKHPQIAECQENLLELAVLILENGDFGQRWDISKVFTYLGSVAIPPLVAILSDDTNDEELRWYAVRILGEYKNTEAILPLVELLQNSDNEELRIMAASALGQLGTSAILVLSELLKDDSTKLLATRSLCYIRHTTTIAPLLTVVEDANVSVRAAAIEALSSFHREEVEDVLLLAIEDEAPAVRREAILGLGFRPDLRDKYDLVTRLQPKLYDLNLEVASAAVVSLSRMGGDIAAQHLYELLVLPDTGVQLKLETIRGLSWLTSISGLEYLQQAFNQVESITLWQEIVTVLGRVKQPNLTVKASEILLEILQSHQAIESSSFRCAVALSLGQLGTKLAIEPLVELAQDSSEQVKLHALASLKNLGVGILS